MAGGLITIEVGLACNNRCHHCPQPPVRAAGARIDPPADELRRRVERARAEGYDEVAFSGGEPTIRPDLADLIRHARELGFRGASITTNGRMLAYPGYSTRLLSAGLTGVSVSLHGPDAETHDGLTGVSGSFRQAARGIAQLRLAADEAGARLVVGTITVLTPRTLPRLRETLVLAGRLGAAQHIVQPFIASRQNVHQSNEFRVERDVLAAGIAAALADPLPHGGRVRPFNVPPCLLPDVGPWLERPTPRPRTFREHDDDLGRGSGRRSSQFHRFAACDACELPCPGLRVEHLTDDEMVGVVLDDAVRTGPTRGDVTLGGLELLSGDGVRRVLAGLRGSSGRLRLLWGGFARADFGEVRSAARALGVDEICLVAQPDGLRWPDCRAWVPGNLERLSADLEALGPEDPEPSLFLVAPMIGSPDFRLEPQGVLALAERLRAAGGRRVYLAAPDRLDDLRPALDDRDVARVAALTGAVAESLGALGLEVVLVRAPSGSGGLEAALSGLPRARWDAGYVRHRFASLDFGWVTWTHPWWVVEAGDARTGQENA